MKKLWMLLFYLWMVSCNLQQLDKSDNEYEVVDLMNQPEIELPYTPEEIENEYVQVTNSGKPFIDPVSNHIYYVKIFLTNASMSDTALRYYIPTFELPFAELEPEGSPHDYREVSGVITYAEYSNVIAVYGMMHGLHYNHFISNKILPFTLIKELDRNDLNSLGFDPSFLYSLDTQITQANLTPAHNSFKYFWTNSSAGVSGSASGQKMTPRSILDWFSPPAPNFTVSLVYTERDPQLRYYKTAPIPLVGVRFSMLRLFASRFMTTDSAGRASTDANWDVDYHIRIKMNSVYAKYTECPLGFADVYLDWKPKVGSSYYHRFTGDIASLFGTFYDLYSFAKSENIYVPKVTYKFADIGPGRGAECLISLIRIQNGLPIFTSSIAHEYGHFIHFHNAHDFYVLDILAANTGSEEEKIKYPDGDNDSLYYDKYPSLLTEGFANFFALAFSLKKYGTLTTYIDELDNRFYERNYGSKEIVYKSDDTDLGDDNSPYIGDFGSNGTLYLYSFIFPIQREASILFDLWDDNTLSIYPSDNHFTEFSLASFQLDWTDFQNPGNNEWSDRWNWQTNYTHLAVQNRENQMDRVNVPLKKIVDMLGQYSIFEADPFYPHKPIEVWVQNSASILGVSQQAIDDLLLLHHSSWPPYIPDDQGPSVTMTYPQNNMLVSTEFNVLGSLSDSFSGLMTGGSSLYYSLFPYNLTNSIALTSGSVNIPLSLSGPGNWRFWISALDNAGNETVVIADNVQASFDYPVIKVTTPEPTFTYTNSVDILVSGTSLVGNSIIQSVQYTVNGGPTNTAIGTTTWNIDLALSDGVTNTLRIWARAANGNVSQMVEREVFVNASIFVSKSGNDSNPGTKNEPFKSIQRAIDFAYLHGYSFVKVATGTYTEASNDICINLKSEISIIGGWNNSFTEKNGLVNRTIIDGSQQFQGIYGEYVTNVILENLVISNCFSKASGSSTLQISYGNISIINMEILDNVSFHGVMNLRRVDDTLLSNCLFEGNTVTNGPYASILANSCPSGKIINCTFNANTVVYIYSPMVGSIFMGYGTQFEVIANTFNNSNCIEIQESHIGNNNPLSLISNTFQNTTSSFYRDPNITVDSVSELNALDENGYNPPGTVYGNW